MLEFRTPTPAEAAEARLDPESINAFFILLIMTVLAGWRYYEGALS